MGVKFIYASLPKKYACLTGNDFCDTNGWLRVLQKSCVCVSLAELTMEDRTPIRDWCEEMFGDLWTYVWDDYYFKTPEAAMLFRLRWLGEH
jgi:hypothetical protein